MFVGNSATTKGIDWRIPAAWLTLCIVWSSTWLAIKVGLRDLPPISYVAIRFLIAIVALIAVSVGHTRLRPKRRSDYGVLAFTGVLMFAINYVLLFWGELYVSSGLAADESCPSDDGSVANDFRHRPAAGDRIYRRWQPSAFSLDRNGNFLSSLSRDHRIVAHLFASLLANAPYVGDEIANHLADHATRRDRTRLGSRWRTIVGLVAPRCLFRPCRGLDDFPAAGG